MKYSVLREKRSNGSKFLNSEFLNKLPIIALMFKLFWTPIISKPQFRNLNQCSRKRNCSNFSVNLALIRARFSWPGMFSDILVNRRPTGLVFTVSDFQIYSLSDNSNNLMKQIPNQLLCPCCLAKLLYVKLQKIQINRPWQFKM